MVQRLAALVCLAVSIPAFAATRTWTGAASANWSAAANWSPSGAPSSGDALTFPSAASNKAMTNDLSGLSVGALTFYDGYSLAGNPLTLTGNIDATNASVLPINTDITLGASLQYNAAFISTFFNGAFDVNGKTLTLSTFGGTRFNGAVSGTGTIACTNIGVVFTHDSSFNGTVQCSAVVDDVLMPDANFIAPAEIFNVSGTIGQLNARTLYVSRLTGGMLTLNTRALTLGNGSYNIELAHGVASDKTVVTGPVTLSGTALNVSLPNGPVSGGDVFVIIDNDGADPVSGTFAGLGEGATLTVGSTQFTISYHGGDGNDVTLTAGGGTAGKLWTGSASGAWSNASNWSPAAAPASGEALVFPAAASNKSMTNDLSGLTTGALTFNDGYTLNGNPLTLGGNIDGSNANFIVLNADLTIGASLQLHGLLTYTFVNGSVDVNGKTLTLDTDAGTRFNGAVGGTGAIACTKGGTAFTHDSSFNGTVQCTATVDDALLPNANFVSSDFIGAGTVGQLNAGSLSIGGLNGGLKTLHTKSLALGTGPYSVELAHGVPSDKTVVAGTVTLSNTSIQVNQPNGPVSGGDVFVIIDNDGSDPVNGTFGGFAEGGKLPVGSTVFAVSYHGGDGNDVTLTALHSTQTALMQTAATTRFGEGFTLNATVTSGGGTPTGSVVFLDNGHLIGIVPLQNGAASLSVSSLETGSHLLQAGLQGSGMFADSPVAAVSHDVTRGATSVVVLSNRPSATYGQTVQFTASVNVTAPAAGAPSGSVTFFADGTSIGSAAVVNGAAALSTATLLPGTPSITASYSGDTHFEPGISAAIAQTVAKAPTAVDARPRTPIFVGASPQITILVNATTNPALIPDGKVIVHQGDGVFAEQELSNGAVTITLQPLSPGDYQLDVTYGGSAKFEGSHVAVRLTIALPSLAVTGARVIEGNSGAKFATVAVTLSNPLTVPVRVSFITLAGSATEGEDYVRAGGVLEFAPGEQSKAIDLQILGDALFEADETFSAIFSDPVNATLESPSAVIVIANDDAAPARRRPARH